MQETENRESALDRIRCGRIGGAQDTIEQPRQQVGFQAFGGCYLSRGIQKVCLLSFAASAMETSARRLVLSHEPGEGGGPNDNTHE